MAGRFNFQSPGAAFVDEMTRVLAERKAEERQKMLDALTQAQEKRAAEAHVNAQAFNKWQMDTTNEQNAFNRAAAVAGNFDMGEDPTGVLPEPIIETGKKHGFFKPKPAAMPSVSTDESFQLEGGEQLPPSGPSGSSQAPAQPTTPPPVRLGAVGSPKEREDARRKAQEGQMISQLVGNPKTAEIGQLMAAMVEGGQEIPAAMWQEVMNVALPGIQTQIFNEAGGTLKPGPVVPRNTQILTQSRPPQLPAALLRDEHIGNNAAGNPVFRRPDGSTRVDTSVSLGDDPNRGPLGIPIGLLKDHRDAIIGALPQDGWPWQGTVPAKPADTAAYQQSAMNLIGAVKKPINQEVRKIATLFISDPEKAREYAKTLTAEGKLSKDDGYDLQILLSTILPSQFARLMYPPKPTAVTPSAGLKKTDNR